MRFILIFIITMSGYSQVIKTSYKYDDLNQLTEVVSNDKTITIYDYDNLGNRISSSTTLSLDKNNLENPIKIFPNPTGNVLNITLKKGTLREGTFFELYDMNGKKIPILFRNDSENVKVDVSSLPIGVYIIHATTEKKKWSKVFIKK